MLVCGDNSFNKLGVQNEEHLLTFKSIKIVKDKVVNLSLGPYHSFLITESGRVIGMGKNTEGQLSIGNCTTYTYPQTVKVPENITVC